MSKDNNTPAFLVEMIKQSFDNLLELVANGKSEQFLAYLAFSARFHKYSSDNRALIYGQCPTATRVAGYKKWQEEGYQVAEGAKAIWIKAPVLKKRKNKETSEDEQVLTGYWGVRVYDVSQLTEDKRPPSFFTPVDGDFEPLYQVMEKAARASGIMVYETSETFGAQGYSTMGKIAIKKGLTSGNRCLVLAHEWSHELIHTEQLRKELGKTVKECHAEATSFIVASYYGIPAPYSSDYLIQWGNTSESLRAEMEVVQKAASKIIACIEEELRKEEPLANTLA